MFFLRDFNLNNEINELGLIINFEEEGDLEKLLKELKEKK